MRIRQVIVTVFEESSFIKRAIHLPAIKNKTGTLIYCRLAETWSFSSLYENQGVCLNKPREKRGVARTDALWKRLNISALKSTTETRAIRPPTTLLWCILHVTCGTGRDHWVFFSVTKEQKKFVVHPPGVWNLNSTWESRWGSWMRYLLPWYGDTCCERYGRCCCSSQDAFRKESLLLNAGEALELSQDRQLQSFLSQTDTKSLFCPRHPRLAGENSAKYDNNKLQLTL